MALDNSRAKSRYPTPPTSIDSVSEVLILDLQKNHFLEQQGTVTQTVAGRRTLRSINRVQSIGSAGTSNKLKRYVLRGVETQVSRSELGCPSTRRDGVPLTKTIYQHGP